MFTIGSRDLLEKEPGRSIVTMKNKSDIIGMPRSRTYQSGRFGRTGLVMALVACLAASACTHYRPLDQGAKVPWAKALASTRGGPIDGDRYRVGQGDALSKIADRYGIRLSALAAANNIAEPFVLYPGEVLRIPVHVPLPSKRPTGSSEPQIAHVSLPPVKVQPSESSVARQARTAEPAKAPAREGKTYVVALGESLSLIAARHGLRIGDLVASNDIAPPYRIKPGQTLIIPQSERDLSRAEAPNQQTDGAFSSPLDPPPPLSREGFLWPVSGQLIGSFEDNKAKGRSGGVTIAARKGTPVLAADNGVVAYAGEALSGYGRLVMLRHAEGYVTLYAHNDVMHVREGDVVRRGQTIAEVGDSGDVSESQLHFELRKGTSPIDPRTVLAGLPGQQVGTL